MKVKVSHRLIVPTFHTLNNDLSDFNWTEIVECPDAMDLWEYGRIQSFCGYLTTTDFGGSKESLPEIERMLEKGDPFILAASNINPKSDDKLTEIGLDEDDQIVAVLMIEPLYEGHKDYNLPAEKTILGGKL